MQLLAYNSKFNVFPFRKNKFQVTNKRVDMRYTADFERIGVFNTLEDAIKFLKMRDGE